MHIIHKGFDTIHVAIQGNISQDVFAYLSKAKERAEEDRKPVPVEIEGLHFDLQPHGGGGYRFLLTGGPMEMRWSIKKPNPKDPWGIRIIVGSTLLATQGLGLARAHIDRNLTRLGIRYGPQHVSIGRADVCVDILAPDFAVDPEHFVIHSHTNRADHHAAPDDVGSHGKSGRYTSVTVGKMPGRQIILYDKRQQVIDAQKPIWWDIWNASLAQDGRPPLDPADAATSRIWRIEVRAGKNLLKDRWQIRTWAQFDAQFGDLAAEAFACIRYCKTDPTDSNRARWPNHPIWDLAASAVDGDLAELRSYLPPDQIKQVHRAEHIKLIEAQVLGSVTTLAALERAEAVGLDDYMRGMGPRLARAVLGDQRRAAGKLEDAKARYRFL